MSVEVTAKVVQNGLDQQINQVAEGKTLMQVRKHLLSSIKQEKSLYDMIKSKALTLSEHLLSEDEFELHINGQSNILDNPEFSTIESIKAFFKTLEDKNTIIRLLDSALLAP